MISDTTIVESVRPRVMDFDLSVEDFIDSIHGRNGFSRDRMEPESARAFDAGVRDILRSHYPDGIVRGEVGSTVTWLDPSEHVYVGIVYELRGVSWRR